MNIKKIGYIISIGVFVISLIIGITIIKNNNELVYTKKDQVRVNEINKKTNEILSELKGLKTKQSSEYNKNGRSKQYLKISYKIDKLNAEKANLDMELSALDSERVVNYKKKIPGVLLIIFGIAISTFIFIKSRKMKDN